MADFRETSGGYITDNDYADFCSSEKKWINKILNLHEKYPDKVEVLYKPEDNWGTIYAKIPRSWLKISPPRQVNYTDEQRAVMAERLADARKKKDA